MQLSRRRLLMWLVGLAALVVVGPRLSRSLAVNTWAWRATHLAQPATPAQIADGLTLAARRPDQPAFAHFAAWLAARGLSGPARVHTLTSIRATAGEARPFPTMWLAEAEAAQGDYQAAIDLWRAAGAAEQLFRLGEQLAEGGDPAVRVAAYAASLALAPRDVVYIRLGDLLLQLKRYVEAQEVYTQGLAAAPTNYGLYVGVGNVYRAQGEYAEAQAWYTQAALRSGVLEWPYLASARAYELQGDLTQARARYTAVTQINPANCEAWGRLGLLSLQAADAGAAVAHLERASATCPDSAWLWVGLGDAQQALAAWAAAAEAYEQALRVQPDNNAAQAGLSQTRAHLSAGETP